MKTIGIARRIDELGRIVIPVEFRRVLGIRDGDELEIAVEGARITLTKVEAACAFCGALTDLHAFHGRHVCGPCLTELRSVPPA